jgi:excisionase family DNA binding protein
VNDDGGKLLSVKQVANRLGCGTTTVWSLVREGSLRAIRIKGVVRIRPEDIEKFQEENPY